ncbi:hypothetical protein JG688_00013491 [Phytophthora aleatoria]|uniref:Uncharacterized protein n=1 Tax=Phytophthora aleatoria TaxID=2496075 RepID=A0A8J5IDH3_9STRA|nr:hypothetical protein JG688_00013491 [Phytophthora aleatoria]
MPFCTAVTRQTRTAESMIPSSRSPTPAPRPTTRSMSRATYRIAYFASGQRMKHDAENLCATTMSLSFTNRRSSQLLRSTTSKYTGDGSRQDWRDQERERFPGRRLEGRLKPPEIQTPSQLTNKRK